MKLFQILTLTLTLNFPYEYVFHLSFRQNLQKYPFVFHILFPTLAFTCNPIAATEACHQ